MKRDINVSGIDIAKRVFHVIGMDTRGTIILPLQRHLQNMLFYHKGLRVRKKPLPFVPCDRKAAILHVQIWSAH